MTEKDKKTENSSQKAAAKKDTSLGIGFSLFISFLVILGSNARYWYFRDFDSTMKQLDNTYSLEMQGIASRNKAVADFYNNRLHFMQDKVKILWQTSKEKIVQAAQKADIPDEPVKNLEKAADQTGFHPSHLLAVSFAVFVVLIGKFLGLVCSFMMYAFTLLIGIMDGLTARYIRTQEAGRESSLIFHKAKKISAYSFYVMLLYLIAPISWNPILGVGLICFILYLYPYLHYSRLKKYL